MPSPVDLEHVSLNLVQSFDEACEFMRWLGESRREALAVDTETGGLEPWKQPLRLVQFGDLTAGWAVPWQEWGGLVKDALRRYSGAVVMHNAKFDVKFLEANGVDIDRSNVHDTQAMAHIIDSSLLKGLKPCAVRYIDGRLSSVQGDLKRAFALHKWSWATVPVDYPDYWSYAALDTVLTSGLFSIFWPQVEAEYREVYELETAATWVIADLEMKGARIDVAYCEKQYEALTEFVDKMATYIQKTYGCGTSDASVASRLQRDGVKLTKTTDTGKPSVDKEVLGSLDHPLAADILERRQAQKIASAYFRNLLQHRDGDIVHPDIDPLGAVTSRMSVSRPALQQIPLHGAASTTVRDAFVARDGNKLIDVDFDQEEQRLVAHFSEDPGMIAAFAEADSGGTDYFTTVARKVFRDPTLTRDDPRRMRTKFGSYAKAYGAGVEKIAFTLKVSLDVAEDFVRDYEAAFPRFKTWQQAIQREARAEQAAHGSPAVRTPWGRRLVGDEESMYAMANYKIQGTAADVLKQKLVDLDCAGLSDYIVLPVHDELLFDVPAADADEVASAVVDVMQETERFLVPLTCASAIGDTWGAIH